MPYLPDLFPVNYNLFLSLDNLMCNKKNNALQSSRYQTCCKVRLWIFIKVEIKSSKIVNVHNFIKKIVWRHFIFTKTKKKYLVTWYMYWNNILTLKDKVKKYHYKTYIRHQKYCNLSTIELTLLKNTKKVPNFWKINV